jgi:hypothetical protein
MRPAKVMHVVGDPLRSPILKKSARVVAERGRPANGICGTTSQEHWSFNTDKEYSYSRMLQGKTVIKRLAGFLHRGSNQQVQLERRGFLF